MTITVEELRRKYPEPRSLPKGSVCPPKGSYCVGGALFEALGLDQPEECVEGFPASEFLAEALHELNDTLDWGDANTIAVHVIEQNDNGNFDDAWAWLDKGLSA